MTDETIEASVRKKLPDTMAYVDSLEKHIRLLLPLAKYIRDDQGQLEMARGLAKRILEEIEAGQPKEGS